MIKNQITISESNIGAYVEKNEGIVNVENKRLRNENQKLKEKVQELEKEIEELKNYK